MLLLFYVRLGAVTLNGVIIFRHFSMFVKYFSSCVNGLGSKAFNCNIISIKSIEVIFSLSSSDNLHPCFMSMS